MKKNLFNRKKVSESVYNGIATKTEYISNVNYTDLEVTDEEKKKLIEYEKLAKENSTKVKEHLFNLAEIFFEAQKLLSSKDTTKGRFLKWVEELGFGKSFVYETLDRYNIYLKHKNNKIFELPVRAVREIKKLSDEKAIDVMVSERPSERLKEIKSEIEIIEEAIVIDNEKEHRLTIITNRLLELEKEKIILEKEKLRLEKELKKTPN